MRTQSVVFNGLSFINIDTPGEFEIKDLRKNFGFNPLELEDYLHRNQVPKIEAFKDHILIVLDFPFFKQNGTKLASPNGTQENAAEKNGKKQDSKRLLKRPSSSS